MLMILAFVVVVVTGIFLFIDRVWYFNKRLDKSKVVYGAEVAFALAFVLLMVQWYNFEFALFATVIISGVIYLLDKLWFSKCRTTRIAAKIASQGDALTESQRAYLNETPTLIDFSKSFFGVLLLVLIIRSCLFSPFRIPSGSLEPTLAIGDFILVNKFSYGVRIPVINKVIIPVGEPKRGDIVVVHWPANEKLDFIKRVVGVPGDTVSYIDKTLYINGQKASQTVDKAFNYPLESGATISAQQRTENLAGIEHGIYVFPGREAADYREIVIPKGQYFIMGDNRDYSEDSRYWGFVSEDQLVGKAQYVVFSWDSNHRRLRWDRTATKIH